jgi:L-amino acid N-acyltransferase
MLEIRRATVEDVPAILEIYNDAVLKTVATFDTETKTLEDRKAWFAHHGTKYPVLVAALGGKVIGWASITPWSERIAYAGTVEDSVYIAEAYRGKGFGITLLKAIIDEGQKAGFHTVIARIANENRVSVKIHEQVGFTSIGIMKECGVKFGRLLDVNMMQKIYD